MKIIIVGCGRVGQMYMRALVQTNQVIGADPFTKPKSFQVFDSIIEAYAVYAPDFWIIASPTEFHLEHLSTILKIQPKANIILEKPAVSINEIPKLLNLSNKYKDARICVSDIYSESPAIKKWTSQVNAYENKSPLLKLEIELSKNRMLDEKSGRFIDKAFGTLGYEGFHLLSILRAVLGNERFNDFCLESKTKSNKSNSSNFLIKIQSQNLPEITLGTSTCGKILILPNTISSLYESATVRSMVINRTIPQNSCFRYRFANAEFEDGTVITLCFEPLYLTTFEDYKNKHLISKKQNGESQFEWVVGNQFEISLALEIETLFKKPKLIHERKYFGILQQSQLEYWQKGLELCTANYQHEDRNFQI